MLKDNLIQAIDKAVEILDDTKYNVFEDEYGTVVIELKGR